MPITQPTIIRLPFQGLVQGDSKPLWRALDECGYKCDVARNAMVRRWLRWREDNPDWLPDPKLDKSGEPRRKKNGDIIRANMPAPKLDDVTLITWLYRYGRTIVPDVSSNVVSQLSKEVVQYLKGKAIWCPGATAFFRHEAIVRYEQSVPTWRTREIPVLNNYMRIGWDDDCWVDVCLWAKGHQPNRYIVRCKTAKMPRGYKHMLHQAIAGELKISDSSIVKRKRRFTELHLVVRVPDKSCDLDTSRILRLECASPDDGRPFRMTWPDGTALIGFGIPVVAEHERINLRRRAIRASQRLGFSRGGHGRRRVYRGLITESRRYQGIQSAFARVLADTVYKACRDHNCGRVEYLEPPVIDRENQWFAQRDTPMDWQLVQSRLTNKLTRRGVLLAIVEAATA